MQEMLGWQPDFSVDQYLHNMSKRKSSLNDKFMKAMRGDKVEPEDQPPGIIGGISRFIWGDNPDWSKDKGKIEQWKAPEIPKEIEVVDPLKKLEKKSSVSLLSLLKTANETKKADMTDKEKGYTGVGAGAIGGFISKDVDKHYLNKQIVESNQLIENAIRLDNERASSIPDLMESIHMDKIRLRDILDTQERNPGVLRDDYGADIFKRMSKNTLELIDIQSKPPFENFNIARDNPPAVRGGVVRAVSKIIPLAALLYGGKKLYDAYSRKDPSTQPQEHPQDTPPSGSAWPVVDQSKTAGSMAGYADDAAEATLHNLKIDPNILNYKNEFIEEAKPVMSKGKAFARLLKGIARPVMIGAGVLGTIGAIGAGKDLYNSMQPPKTLY
jgi:hypothetical protein